MAVYQCTKELVGDPSSARTKFGIFIRDHKSMIVSGPQSSHALKTLKTTVAVGAHYITLCSKLLVINWSSDFSAHKNDISVAQEQ